MRGPSVGRWAGPNGQRTRKAKEPPTSPKNPTGLLFGWSLISHIDGQPYYDAYDTHFPEAVVLRSAEDFMQGSREVRVRHDVRIGKVVFAMPLTSDIAAALGITTERGRTGLIVGWRPDDPRWLERYESGDLTGLSIGGKARLENVR
jgi:hypothetical protein